MVRLGNIAEVDALFTDQQPPATLVEVMGRAEVRLFVVGHMPDSDAMP